MQVSFTIPVPLKVLTIFIVIIAVLMTILLLMLLPICLLKITISSNEIVVRAIPMYSFSARREDVEEVFIADLSLRKELKPVLRIWGHGLPGYALGWFRLGNGAKAFCAISSNTAVVFKLKDGSHLIVTPTNVTEFISALRELGWNIS